jgi:hypothetical protein
MYFVHLLHFQSHVLTKSEILWPQYVPVCIASEETTMMTAEPAVVIPLQIDDDDGDHASVHPQSRKSSMNTSGPNQGVAQHHHHNLQHHAQPGQMLRRTSAAIPRRGSVTSSPYTGDEHTELSFSYLHSPKVSPRSSPRRTIDMPSPLVSPRFNYGTTPGSARFAGVMPSPTQSQSSRLTIPNGLPQSPRL